MSDEMMPINFRILCKKSVVIFMLTTEFLVTNSKFIRIKTVYAVSCH